MLTSELLKSFELNWKNVDLLIDPKDDLKKQLGENIINVAKGVPGASLFEGMNVPNISTNLIDFTVKNVFGAIERTFIHSDNIAESIIMDVGGIIGSMLLSEIPVVGNALGNLLGRLIASGLYEGLDHLSGRISEAFEDDPYYYRYIGYDAVTESFVVTGEGRKETGGVPQIVGKVQEITDLYTGQLNAITDSIGRHMDLSAFNVPGSQHAYFGYHHGNHTSAGADDFKVVLGQDVPGKYINSGGDLDKIVRIGMEYELRRITFFDGDLVKAAAHQKWVSEFTGQEDGDHLKTLASYLSVAEDYRTYLENTARINAVIDAFGNTPFTVTWEATLLKALNMGFVSNIVISEAVADSGNANDIVIALDKAGKITSAQVKQVIEGAGGFTGQYGGGRVTAFFNNNREANYKALVELVKLGLYTNEKLSAYSLNNTFLSADGNDDIKAYGGDDNVKTYGGNDVIAGGLGADTLDAGDGDDKIFGGIGIASPSDSGDVIYGGHGKDEIYGNGGDDLIYGGIAAADPTDDPDVINGGLGNDTIYGNGGDDLVLGTVGNDLIFGGAGGDKLLGGEDADKIYGNDGNDLIYGGSETEDADLRADELHGEAGNDTIYGNAGNDFLYGGEGSDILNGNTGNDVIFGGAGSDVLNGNEGNDVIHGTSAARDPSVIDFADLIFGGDGNDILYGDAGNDKLSGNNGADKLLGGEGSDTLFGGTGADRLFGEAGNDILKGESGADTLFGNAGNDHLNGGSGNDSLTGGAGKDVFVLAIGSGKDTIQDFIKGLDEVKIQLRDDIGGVEDILDRMTKVTGGVSLNLGDGDSVFFKGLKVSDLTADHFILFD